jgi:hypothetical protein
MKIVAQSVELPASPLALYSMCLDPDWEPWRAYLHA